ncbi:DEAD/DEAH box helicase [Lentimicrobium saccharophilum]|nr:DEAD/DEAH box helicase [Lentimicrobium saccharophilum]
MLTSFIERLGIQELNELQLKSLEFIRPGTDLILISKTGSGKTLAFLLPILRMLVPELSGPQAMIITPSRELALQIESVFRKMQTGHRISALYGGHAVRTERNNLIEPAALLVGTPGRIADHLRREHFDPAGIKSLVLDEFDKSLELGFEKEMTFIIAKLAGLQTRILTSATRMEDIPAFTGVTNPVSLDFTIADDHINLAVNIVRAEGNDKLEALFRLICHLGNDPALIFCNHREAVERISTLLRMRGVVHGIYHGGMEQDARELALIRFRNGTHHTLITTDLAARGLDIPEIRHVIHYQQPANETVWVHRNGRTARMHASGDAWMVLAAEENAPVFVTGASGPVLLPEETDLPGFPEYETLYFSLGKKDKISRGDIAGFLMHQGGLNADDLGQISIADHASYAAVKRPLCRKLLADLKGRPLKRRQIKIEIAR